MALPSLYKIHPAIGFARLGDASTFFIGPETPGLAPTGEKPGTAVPPYKDGGKIKPQAARFRIYEYLDDGKGRYYVSREMSLVEKDVTRLEWTVHLANRKASFFEFGGLKGGDRPPGPRRNAAVAYRDHLEIDPGPRSIAGRSAKAVEFRKGASKNPSSERWPTPAPAPPIETLGTLLTDDAGRLVALGGRGVAGSQPGAAPIASYANNDGWFDDVSDGPVTASLFLKGKPVQVTGSWLVCPPPDFAPALTSVVTLYDLLYDLAARELTLPTNEALYTVGELSRLSAISAEFKKAGKPVLSTYEPDFNEEIYPILYRTAASMFLAQQAVSHHSVCVAWTRLAKRDPAYEGDRKLILTYLRQPDAKPTSTFPRMPKLLGDEPYVLPAGALHNHIRLTVTPTQYALLQQWAKGKFKEPPSVPPTPPTAPNVTPHGLDRAALENCVGGAFFPGIEVGWQIRSAGLYAEPFRIKAGSPTTYRGDAGAVRAGHFTRQMALPWHADFLQCKTESSAEPGNPFSGTGAWGWWPAQRPDWVFTTDAAFRAVPPAPVAWHRATAAGAKVPWPVGFPLASGGRDPDVPSYDEMLANWRKFGFVVAAPGGLFLETERESTVP